jgi:uncharacterized protein
VKTDRYTSLRAVIDETGVEAGTIEGIAVKYGVDVPRGARLFERVEPGAFAAQLVDPARVAVLWQHDTDSPIGRVTSLNDSDTELRFTAKISDHADIPDARKARAVLQEGLADEISVGFEWGKWQVRDDEAGTFTIVHTKARLRELSVVTFGALGREARVLTVAADDAVDLDVKAIRARLQSLNS